MTEAITNAAGSCQQFRYGMGDTLAAAQTLARIRAYSRVAALRRPTNAEAARPERRQTSI